MNSVQRDAGGRTCSRSGPLPFCRKCAVSTELPDAFAAMEGGSAAPEELTGVDVEPVIDRKPSETVVVPSINTLNIGFSMSGSVQWL